ncbi:MAG: magnesium transporter [Deltaproteobacteria bacterium]|nr:magnesium transporter [Deltaproteobacteria bacterium]
MNEFMKGITIIATIFIPMTCFVGVCGVNYKYMPELKWSYGYLLLRLIRLGIALTMLVLFSRMIWF